MGAASATTIQVSLWTSRTRCEAFGRCAAFSLPKRDGLWARGLRAAGERPGRRPLRDRHARELIVELSGDLLEGSGGG